MIYTLLAPSTRSSAFRGQAIRGFAGATSPRNLRACVVDSLTSPHQVLLETADEDTMTPELEDVPAEDAPDFSSCLMCYDAGGLCASCKSQQECAPTPAAARGGGGDGDGSAKQAAA